MGQSVATQIRSSVNSCLDGEGMGILGTALTASAQWAPPARGQGLCWDHRQWDYPFASPGYRPEGSALLPPAAPASLF